MESSIDDIAEKLTDHWLNGNLTDTIREISFRGRNDPRVSMALTLKVQGLLSRCDEASARKFAAKVVEVF